MKISRGVFKHVLKKKPHINVNLLNNITFVLAIVGEEEHL